MIQKLIFNNRDAWLAAREGKIGGSDAGCILGLNPWKSNVDLYLEKIGEKRPDDLSDNPLVQYGIAAEEHIRALFALDYPEYFVWYEENNMFQNDRYPWAHYSADGLLTDKSSGQSGILEIKTATIQSAAASDKWKDGKIPPSYLAQVLHAMAIMEADFAYLRALLHYPKGDGETYITIRDYTIRMTDTGIPEQIKYLMAEEKAFAVCMREKRTPDRILPLI